MQKTHAKAINKDTTVQRMCPNGQWEIELMEETTTQVRQQKQDLIDDLQQQFNLNAHVIDTPHWRWNKEGNYMVSSFYHVMSEGPETTQTINRIWKLKAALRVVVFI